MLMSLGKNATPGRHLPSPTCRSSTLHTIVPRSRAAPHCRARSILPTPRFRARRTGAASTSIRSPSCNSRNRRPTLRVAAKLSDGSPLLIDRKVGEGHVIVFTSAFDNSPITCRSQPVWLPFLDQTTHEMGGIGAAPGNYKVGSYVDLRTAKEKGVPVEIIGPGNKRVLTLSESAKATHFPVPVAGFLRYPPRQRPGRTGRGQSGPPRIRFHAHPTGDARIVEKYGYSLRSRSRRPRPTDNQREDTSELWWWVLAMLLFWRLRNRCWEIGI